MQRGALDVRTRHTSGGLSDAQRVSGAPVSGFWLATGALGQALLAWTPSDATATADLRVATRVSAGGRFGDLETVTGVRPGLFHGGLVMLADGTTLIASGQDARVRVLGRASGEHVVPAPELDAPGDYPLIAVGGNRVVAAWSTFDGERVGLQASVRSRASR